MPIFLIIFSPRGNRTRAVSYPLGSDIDKRVGANLKMRDIPCRIAVSAIGDCVLEGLGAILRNYVWM